MSLLLVGLNHTSAPVAVREQLALTDCALPAALRELAAQRGTWLDEVLLLSTCNRFECYLVAPDAAAAEQALVALLARQAGLLPQQLAPYLYVRHESAATRHLMRVASGLDSLILGEPQILGQVAEALGHAQQAGSSGPLLSHLFTQSLHVGKRARHESAISRHTTSVSHAAAALLQAHSPQPAPRVLIIGAGEMARLAAQALHQRQIHDLTFINRTHHYAAALAERIAGQSLPWSELGRALLWADAILSATGAPHPVLHVAEVEQSLAARAGRPLLIVDIAVPRDVEPEVGTLPTVTRFDIDALRSIVDANNAQRRAAIPFVEQCIEEGVRDVSEWQRVRQVAPLIQQLHAWAAAIAQQEGEEALNKLGHDEQSARVIQRMGHRIVRKLLHEPTLQLRRQAVDGHGCAYAQLVGELFALEGVGCGLGEEQGESALPCQAAPASEPP